jgi:hypothetical protein
VEFSEAKDHREHFKSDWHRLNLKRKVAGQTAVSEEEFASDPALLLEECTDINDYVR